MSANSIHPNSLQQQYYPNSMATNFNPIMNPTMPQANSFVINQQQMTPFVNNSLVNTTAPPSNHAFLSNPTFLPPVVPNPSQHTSATPSFLSPATSTVNPTSNTASTSVQTPEFYEMQKMMQKLTNDLTKLQIKQDAQDQRVDRSQGQ